MPYLLALAALAFAPAASAATTTVGCYVLARDEPPRFLASKLITLTDQENTREFYREGSAVYEVKKVTAGNEKFGYIEQMEIWVKDPARDLEMRAVRTMGSTHRDDLQLWPPHDLPPGFCNPRPDKAGEDKNQQKKEGQP